MKPVYALVALLIFSIPSVGFAQAVRPLPPDIAKDLELLGKGVVGKALPAPPLDDLITWYMATPKGGSWTYHVVKGKEKHLREETIVPIPDRSGLKAWKQKLGDEYVQFMTQHADGSIGKYGEDDVGLSYGCHFHPGIFITPGLKAGESKHVPSKALAYKSDKSDHISYTGEMDNSITYVGAYEVTTPAGTFPAALMRAEFDIKIGPAKVKDVQYSFYAKGVGKVAEIEGLKVSALLIYHSNEKTAKVLAEKPKLTK